MEEQNYILVFEYDLCLPLDGNFKHYKKSICKFADHIGTYKIYALMIFF